MEPRSLPTLAALLVGLAALVAAWPTPAVAALPEPEPAPATVDAAPAPSPAPLERRSAHLVREPTSQADVHELRRQTAAADIDAVPELRALALQSRSPIAVGHALTALARLGALVDDAELMALLDDPRPRVRQELVVALGQPGESRAIEPLCRAARGEADDLHPLAIQALGRIGGPEAAAGLRRLRTREGWTATEQAFLARALREATHPGPAPRFADSPEGTAAAGPPQAIR